MCDHNVSSISLALARALVGGPSLLILDEPTKGLDGEVSRRFRDLLVRLARDAGVGTLFTTDSLETALECAARVIVMEGGRVIHSGSAAQIRAAGSESVVTLERAERAAEELVRVRGIAADLTSPETIRFGSSVDIAGVVSWLVARGYRLIGLYAQQKRWGQAIKYARELVRRQPDDPQRRRLLKEFQQRQREDQQ